MKNFIIKHPNEFAIIDEQVILVCNPIIPQQAPPPRVVTQTEVKQSSEPVKKISPPSKTTIESISKCFMPHFLSFC